MPVSYAMTLQKSNLTLVGEGCGMRLLAYHPLLSYSHQQRHPLHQGLLSDALSSHQNWLPIASYNGKPKFNQKTLKLSNHARRFAYLVQEQMHLSLA
jgi:hypothetical protein